MFMFFNFIFLLANEPIYYEPHEEKGISTILKENYQLIFIIILFITTIIFLSLFINEKRKKK